MPNSQNKREIVALPVSHRAMDTQTYLGLVSQEIGLWSWNSKTRTICLQNERMATLLGVPGTTMLDPPAFYALIDPESRHCVRQAINEGLITQRSLNCTFEVHGHHETSRWIEIQAHPTYDPEGELISLVGIAYDRTTQHTLETRLQLTEAYREVILEQFTEGYFRFDAMWRCTYMNRPAERFLQQPRTAVIGKTFQEILALFPQQDTIHQTRFEAQAMWAKATCQASDFEFFSRSLQKWFLASLYPFNNGLIIFFQNIMKWKQIEHTLAALEQKVRCLADISLMGIATYTTQGHVLEANKSYLHMLGFTYEDVAHGDVMWTAQTPPEYLEQSQLAMEQMRQSGTFVPFEKEYVTKQGKRIHVLVAGSAFDEQAETFLCCIFDLSQQDTREKQRMVMKSILGHEMRTPLTVISGILQLMSRRIKRYQKKNVHNCEESDRLLSMCMQEAEKTARHVRIQNRLINDILDSAHASLDTLEVHLNICNFGTLITNLLQDFQLTGSDQDIQFVAPTQTMWVYADEDRLTQVLANYLSNALKYTRPGTAVVVALTADHDNVRCSVCDHGPGLSVTDQQQIWEPLARVTGITSQKKTDINLGLGLYVCRTLVEKQGGKVGVTSIPGEGACFWLSLPRAFLEQPTVPAVPEQETIQKNKSSKEEE